MNRWRPAATGRSASGGNAQQQLNAIGKHIAGGRPFAQAHIQALMDNPHLYTAYLAQHPRQSGA